MGKAGLMKLKGYRSPTDIIRLSVRWYLRYNLSYRDLTEMLEERGVSVTPTSWVQRFTPQLLAAFRKNKSPVAGRWQMDETYIRVKGQHRYLYRAVDKHEDTVDFLLTAHRDRHAAKRFLKKAAQQNGVPTHINIDKSGANKAGIEDYNGAGCDAVLIDVRQCTYLNNIVEQDHRFIKRRIRPVLGFKSFWTARFVLDGIELVHMLRKGQLAFADAKLPPSAAEAFYALAAA